MSENQRGPALVLLSGGQDSTTAVYWARAVLGDLYTISYDYGQRHKPELEAAFDIAELAHALSHQFITVPGVFAQTALAADDKGQRAPISAGDGYLGLPSTFTPGRNAIFLTL